MGYEVEQLAFYEISTNKMIPVELPGYDELIARKMYIFKFVQQYYRCFMGCKSVKEYPIFEF